MPFLLLALFPSLSLGLDPNFVSIIFFLARKIAGFGPFIAALILTSINYGKNGLREYFDRLIKWKVKIKWYIAAFGTPFLLYLVPTTFVIIFGGSFPLLVTGIQNLLFPIEVILFFIFIFLISGGNEEPGWRGFALPKLQDQYSPLVSNIILGTFWACLHLPLFFIPESDHYTENFLINFSLFLFFGIGLSFIIAWIYNNTESILLAMIFHSAYTVSAWLLIPPKTSLENQNLNFLFGAMFLALLYGIGIFLLYFFNLGVSRDTRLENDGKSDLENIV
ncbi:MAG: CPBP family intramembrane glutamic endopeptidase [Candidatus Hodarchaeota archaeon]